MPMKNTMLRRVECTVLFFIAPGLLYLLRHQMAFRVFFLLVFLAICLSILLLKDPNFDRTVFRRKMTWPQARSMLFFFIPTALPMTLLTFYLLPSKFLAFPSAKPATWLIVMLIYPFLMVLPQELLFRTFFFHRYRSLFEDRPLGLIFLNAFSFGLSHLFYGNWVAPVLSFFGGLLFAWRYQNTRSLPAVCVEHAVWGNFLFTVGIGWYFYSGSIT